MRRRIWIIVLWVMVLALLTLVACGTQLESSSTPEVVFLDAAPVGTSDQATQAAALTLAKEAADHQAAASAEIMRRNAQATLNSANATLSAALTQDQNNANAVAAQIAADAEIVRANAQATVVAAGSTQSAAQTQDAFRQTQVQYAMEMTVAQQNSNIIAAGTQTAVANTIATQTQAARATSDWYADQSRQRQEQRQAPLALLWMWCLPVFIVLLAGLFLWGLWRWLKNQPNRRQTTPARDRFLPPGNNIVNRRHPLTRLEDPVRGWLEEVRRKLQGMNRKDEDDYPDD